MGLYYKIFPGAKEYERLKPVKLVALGFQHAFAMSCATILVPLLTGLDVGVALLAAGVGTIIFHLCTGGHSPVFLGSSFAFIGALQQIIGTKVVDSNGVVQLAENGKPLYSSPGLGIESPDTIAYAMGGIIAAGALYLIFALLVRILGKGFIDKLFPPLIRGVGIILIGLSLAGAAINNIQDASITGFENFTAGYYWNWGIALVVCILAVVLSSYGKGMVKMSSIFIALVAGYLGVLLLTKTGLAPEGIMNTASIADYKWFQVPNFTLPKFSLPAIAAIAPIAIISMVEHVGDVYANGEVVGKNFTDKPGLHRTLLGDGLATMAAGFMGGPANTTYSENTAVLAATGNYNPASLRFAAIVAIVVSFFGKAIGVIGTVPTAVLGGVCIVLYGMISSVGLRTLVENKVDFKINRNLCITAVMLVLCIGGAVIGAEKFSVSGIGLGVIMGIILNLILPQPKDSNKD